MLKPVNRLKKIRDFNLVIKHGRWVSGNLLSIKILELAKIPENSLPKTIKADKEDLKTFVKQLKVGFSVGLKFHKTAVKRNRIKRQIREVVRLLIKENQLKTGYYLLIQPKKECLEEDYTKISKEIKLLLKKSKILVVSK